jgi:hypothetical protein
LTPSDALKAGQKALHDLVFPGHTDDCGGCRRAVGGILAAIGYEEQQREWDAQVRQWHLLLQDLHAHIDPEGMDPELARRLEITLETGCVKDCGSCERALTAESCLERAEKVLREMEAECCEGQDGTYRMLLTRIGDMARAYFTEEKRG